MKYWLIILAMLALHAAQVQAAITTTGQEQSLEITGDWLIFVPPSPHPALLRAARDLQDFLRERHDLSLRLSEQNAGKGI